MLNSLIWPSGVMRPIAPGSPLRVNQRLPSGPATMSVGAMFGVRPMLFSVITPSGVMRPMRPGLADSVNQRLPSSPAAIALGMLPGVSPALNSVIVPSGVMRPMKAGDWLTNQRLSSGPTVMSQGSLAVRPVVNSVTPPSLVTRAIAPFRPDSAIQRLPSGPRVMPLGLPASREQPGELADEAVAGRDRAEGAEAVLGEPELAVVAVDDVPGAVAGAQAGLELGDRGLVRDRGSRPHAKRGEEHEQHPSGELRARTRTLSGRDGAPLDWTFVRCG